MKDSKQLRSDHQSFVDAWKTINENTTATLVKETPEVPVVEEKVVVEKVLVRTNNAFTEQAEKYQMVVKQFARFVEANNHLFDIPTRKKAVLANKFQGFKEDIEWDEFFGDQELIDENLLKKFDNALGRYKTGAGDVVRKTVKGAAQNLGKIAREVKKGYDQHEEIELDEYTITNADISGNTQAYKNYKAGMKNKLTGNPLYKLAPHVKLANSNELEGEKLQEVTTKDTKSGTKFKVRVKDKATGSSYIRFATREKIAQLRSDPKIASVEMTDEGQTPEERGEKKAKEAGGGAPEKKSGDKEKEANKKVVHGGDTKKRKRSVTTEETVDEGLGVALAGIAGGLAGAGLGHWHNKARESDEKKRKARKKVAKESISDWRQELKEIIGEVEIKEAKKSKKKTKNGVCVNPDTDDEKNKYEGVDAQKVAESIGAELKGLEIEDADGKLAFEVVDLIKPEPMKGMASEEVVDEGAGEWVQDKLKKVDDVVTKASKTKVGKVVTPVLKKVFGPWKSTDGGSNRKSPTAASQAAKGLRTGN
tara:strand:- start:17 stop:1621 length:1605 start_codon:yes stop_codon:yes gene_type:complete